eukprot:IDg17623t1
MSRSLKIGQCRAADVSSAENGIKRMDNHGIVDDGVQEWCGKNGNCFTTRAAVFDRDRAVTKYLKLFSTYNWAIRNVAPCDGSAKNKSDWARYAWRFGGV